MTWWRMTRHMSEYAVLVVRGVVACRSDRAMTDDAATDLPSWDERGLLPPVRPGADGTSPDRSPYRTTILEVTRCFSMSAERRKILRGFLALRSKLYELGFSEGFQWLNGSFFEHVEATLGRPPGDIDVVTFTKLGTEASQLALIEAAPDLFYPRLAKQKYLVDHYFSGLGEEMQRMDVRWVAYWYSMWSHRRDNQWKGFVEISLDTAGDAGALALLDTQESEDVT